jgi:hypothetical protein
MDNHFLMTDDMLWDYADGLLTAPEKEQVDAYLHQHPEWQSRLDVVLLDRKAFSAFPLDKPDTGFADKVMAAWAVEHVHSKATRPGNDWIVRLIAIVFGTFILAPLVMVFAMATTGGEDTPVRWQLDLPSVDLASWLSHPALHYSLYLVITYLALSLVEKFIRRQTSNV